MNVAIAIAQDLSLGLSAEALRPALHNKYAMLVVLSGQNLALHL